MSNIVKIIDYVETLLVIPPKNTNFIISTWDENEIEAKKDEWQSKHNKRTTKLLSGTFDWDLHMERGLTSKMETSQDYTGRFFKDMILKDIIPFSCNSTSLSQEDMVVTEASFVWVRRNKKPTLLDIGCGQGTFVKDLVHMGKFERVYGLDPFSKPVGEKFDYIQAWSHNIPHTDKSVDILTCCEVLEHIPESYVLETLKEFKRVTNWRVYGQVATRLGGEKYIDGIQAHLCYAPGEWWCRQIIKSGFKIISANQGKQGLAFVLEA